MSHAARALESHDLSGKGIDSGSHTYFFDHTRTWWASRLRDQLNAGPPPRQHEHEGRYTPSTYPFNVTRRKDDYDGKIIFGDLRGLKLPGICLTGEEKSPKKPRPGYYYDRGSNPGPLSDRRACLSPAPQRWTN